MVVTVRFADFETKSWLRTLPQPTDSVEDVQATSMKRFLPFLDRCGNPRRNLIPLVDRRVETLRRKEPENSRARLIVVEVS